AESLQITNAYKIRGVLNCLLSLRERDMLPKKIVSYSSGNHAKALAYASSLFDIDVTIFMPKYTSIAKQNSVKRYNVNLVLTDTRAEAEENVQQYARDGYYNIHPSSNDMVIAGNGTICFEALKYSNILPDAVFAPCGGGGLLSGCLIASRNFAKKILIYGGEPKLADDAHRSLESGKIFRFDSSPNTIADGARTLSITDKNFSYLKEIDGIYTIDEYEIMYWTVWIGELLNIPIEPTAALAFAAATRWLIKQNESKNIIVIISGGNIDQNIYEKLSLNDYLKNKPNIEFIKSIIN
ncbi:MAG: pyridoxal-phosphate dependent enzyme, partial [Rickettsiales bacterium]